MIKSTVPSSLAFFGHYLASLAKKMTDVDANLLMLATNKIIETGRAGGKTIIVGNGGSAAIASHVSVDFTKAAKIRCINFNEADLITCFANDYGYEHWVARALEAYADNNDIVVLISSSGQSENILNGAIRAREMGLFVITLSGFLASSQLRKLGDVNFWCDSECYNTVEMSHHTWLLAMVDYVAQNQL